MSADLGASESQIGQLVAIYAVTTAITAIPLTAVTRSLPRKPLLVGLVIGFALVNGVTAIADSYTVILIARMFGGMLAGLLWAMAAGYAMRTVEPEHSGRALSIAMVGTPLAFAFACRSRRPSAPRSAGGPPSASSPSWESGSRSGPQPHCPRSRRALRAAARPGIRAADAGTRRRARDDRPVRARPQHRVHLHRPDHRGPRASTGTSTWRCSSSACWP
ncbi:MFS transporter [Agromyces hippuratus]|uniref:MFS transporter n=1 Tax=Agromyces hippuratus TaxID=286438 RepID=UPI0035EF7EAA